MRHFLLYFLLIQLSYSCAPRVYTPTAFNAPFLAKKGDFNGAISLSPSLVVLNANVQVAYAITNNFAIIGNGNYKKTIGSNDLYHALGEVGLGYFKNYNTSWIFEGFLGYGFGKGTYKKDEDVPFFYSSPDINIHSYYNKIFLQMDGGIKSTNGVFETGLILRPVVINYLSMKVTNTVESYNRIGATSFLLEPGVFFRVGKGNLKFQTQVGACIPIINVELYYVPEILNFGAFYKFK